MTATGASTNRNASEAIGAAQTSAALTTNAVGTAQSGWLRRYVAAAPLAAQTISAQVVTYSQAASESNAASNYQPSIGIYVWRPGTQTTVGTVLAVGTLLVVEPGTAQTAGSATATSTSVTAQLGDLLVIEVWRANIAQGTSVARTNTTFYDGTTEASTSNEAAFVSFPNTIAWAQVLTATASFAGAENATTARALAGAVSYAGSVARQSLRSVNGALSATGSFARATARSLSAVLTSAGNAPRAISHGLAGVLDAGGSLTPVLIAGTTEVGLRAIVTYNDP